MDDIKKSEFQDFPSTVASFFEEKGDLKENASTELTKRLKATVQNAMKKFRRGVFNAVYIQVRNRFIP
jgi:hypothetical protein